MAEQHSTKGLLRQWIHPPAEEIDPEFATAIGGHTLVAQILYRRGIRDLPTAQAFLNPDAYSPTPPEALPGVEQGCERVERAIRDQETLCVWGDFDVDGQTSTSLLVSALRGLGANVVYHIPVRARESHGVNVEYLRPILDGGASLVVTCDTGISAHEALNFAHERGVDVIVTDHHALPETLPQAYTLINPKLLPAHHPLSGLPGVGVAYKFAEALYQRAGRSEEMAGYLDLVALGIVADLAEQTRDTRYLLQKGLPVLRAGERTGLQAMFELSALQPAFLTEEHIGFVLGPRLNALGRLDDANPAVELLTTSDLGRARVLATHLEGLNARRRMLTGQVLRAAQAQIERDPDLLEKAVLVLAHSEWPAGVIGIVASELTERYNRPTILLSAPPGELARGSARSIEGVNITEAIASQKNLLLGYGGHPMAAGLSMDPANLPRFRHGISRYVENALGGITRLPTLTIDGAISLADLSLELVADLERLAPFGAGNPPLVLEIPQVEVLNASTIGRDGSHLQITIKDAEGRTGRVLWWGGADWPLPEGRFDLACVVRASNFRGQRSVQVEWIDARPIESEEITLRRTLTVVDQRGVGHPLPVLQGLLAEEQPGGEAVIWAEAEARDRLAAAGIAACDRTQLSAARTLILWSTPAGRAELDAALEAVHPGSIILFGVDPADDRPEGFLKRLAGLVKYTLDKLDGTTSLPRLAGAVAQREITVRLGLQWLEQRSMVRITWLAEGGLQLSAGEPGDAEKAKGLLSKIEALVAETAAFRRFFQMAEKDNLL